MKSGTLGVGQSSEAVGLTCVDEVGHVLSVEGF